ncbi:MAG: hypothetical protein M1828_002998 [Chrysothrix sp. TS-e1954]|nr:MAG: hypothetical protein M1828_002998 [Chrysothrix sp. TS-e1954]
MTEDSSTLGLAVAIGGVVFLIYHFFSPSKSLVESSQPLEPAAVSSRIPLIGHLLGLIRDTNNYYTYLSSRVPDLPIFTISLFFSFKAYVVTSPLLVAAVHRHYKSLSFDPLLEHTAKRLVGMSKDGLQKLTTMGVPEKLFKNVHPAMLPGLEMDHMSRVMLTRLENALNTLAEQVAQDESKSLDLYRWTRQTIGLASTDAVYGPQNPFQDPKFFELFEQFEQNIMPLFLNFYPRVFARKAFDAREYCVTAYTKFIADGSLNSASSMVQAHDKTHLDAGLSSEDTARQGIALGLGVMGNIIPSSFWMLFHIYDQPELLDELRKEVEPLLSKDADGKSENVSLDVTSLQTEAPKLSSMFHEVLRYRSTLASVRFVKEDTILAPKDPTSTRQYMLKKGNIVQMPGHVVHRRPDTWGTDADSLRPNRFIDFLQGNEKIQPVSYRAFGGGDHICPGRYFSATEVLSFVTCFIVRFNLERTTGLEDGLSGYSDTQKPHANMTWKEPALMTSMFSSSILPPRDPIPVKITTRDEWRGSFKLTMSDAGGKFKLASG